MKAGWRRESLRSVSTLISGQHIESAHYNTAQRGVGYLTGPSDFGAVNPVISKWTEHPKVIANAGDILITVKGSGVGGINLLDTNNVAISRQLMAIRVTAGVPEFIFLALESMFDHIQSLATGAAIPGISREQLLELEIAFPPVPEQRRIVAILDEAFEGIATAKANAEKNLQNARELAAALGEACFEQSTDPSFASRQLAELCELIVDCEHKTAPVQDEGYPSIRTPNIGRGKLLLDGVNRVSEETYVAWTRRAIPLPGDLIFAREAPAGNVAVIPDDLRVCLGQRTVLIRPRREVFEPEYLAHLLLQRGSQQRLLAHSRGATVQHVNMRDIRAFKISSVPPLPAQRKAIDQLLEIEQTCEALEKLHSRKLAALGKV